MAMDNTPDSEHADDQALREILVESGRISSEASEQLARKQAETGASLGEAGEELGLLTQEDVHYAIALRTESDLAHTGQPMWDVRPELVTLYNPVSAAAEALRSVRSRLMLSWFEVGGSGKSLAIVSPQRGEGRSCFTANMGVLFAQLGERTLVIDADLRHPRQHELFGLDNDVGLSNVLKGQAGADKVQAVPGVPGLRVLTAGTVPFDPQETVSRSSFAVLLKHFTDRYNIILIDTPALADVADGHTIAVRAGSALFVTRQGLSKMSLLDHYCTLLQRSSVSLAGSVMIA